MIGGLSCVFSHAWIKWTILGKERERYGVVCVLLTSNAIPSSKPFCIEIRSFPIPILLISFFCLEPPHHTHVRLYHQQSNSTTDHPLGLEFNSILRRREKERESWTREKCCKTKCVFLRRIECIILSCVWILKYKIYFTVIWTRKWTFTYIFDTFSFIAFNKWPSHSVTP